MATYYVDGNTGNDSNNGSSGQPWKQLAKAINAVHPGDEVRIRTAVYHEELPINVENTTWKADTGHKPVLDGRYHDGLFENGRLPTPEPGHGYLPLPEGEGTMVRLRADGVTVDGLTIQNCAGSALGASASDTTIRNCRVDFTYRTGIKINAGVVIDNVVIENNICTRLVQRLFDPNRDPDSESQAAGAAITMVRVRDGIIRNNVFAYSMGEGIDVDKGSYRLTVEGNIVHTCNHVHIYVNRSIDPIIRNNLIYHLYHEDYLGVDPKPPAAIIFGDENTSNPAFPFSSGGQIYNNIVIGLGKLFMVRNNSHNYNTQLNNAYIGFNTFIGGSKTDVGIHISGNLKGRPHINSIFENNIIMNVPQVSYVSGDISGLAFRNNLWSELPHQAMRGPGDRIGNPKLVDPTAEIDFTFPQPNTGIDPGNYQLSSHSALAIGMASDGSTFNGLHPPAINKDFFGANRDSQPDIGAHEFAGAVVGLTANFSIGPGQGAGPLPHTVDFTDKSVSQQPIVAHAWDFGDGQTSTETNPSHTYTTAGEFDVSLTVTDDQGNSDTLTQPGMIAVTQEPDTVVPDTFRRFVLVQSASQQVLAYGTQYPDMRCVVIWNDDPFHLLNFADVEDVVQSLADDTAELFWIDPGDQDEPILSEDDADPVEWLAAIPAGVRA